MNLFKRIRDFFRNPGMIGTPPSARSVWHDPAAHAKDFAERYAGPLDYLVSERMMQLGIPDGQIGARDVEHGIQNAAFMPHESGGGGNSPDGRLNLDSGILNPELFKHLGAEASDAYAGARLRTRVDAGIAHEFEEAKSGGDHRQAVERAPDTTLPISHEARELARKLRDGERKRRLRAIPPVASILLP
jgi:hypothetical protein